MIRHEELRIGNTILRNGIVVTVDHQSFRDVEKYPDQYQGIELTEDWLIRMGFTVSGGWIYKFGVTESDVNDGVHYVLESNTILIGNHNKLKYKIKYVHQLQNLYFALTEEELQLKY